ncbi:FG-GAP-like repeat-containing protein [Paenarthrobacter sp. C1]
MRSYLARIVSVVVLALVSAVAVQSGNPAVAAPEVSDSYEGSGTFTSVAYDPATGLFYAADLLGDTVSVFRNGVLTTKVVVGQHPAAMALDPLTHSVYVVNSASDSVSIINGTTVTATIPVEHQPMDVAVDPGTGKIYVANGMTGLTVIEGDQVTGTIPIDGGYVWAVALDTSTHTVYAANYSNSKVSVINDGVVTQTIPTTSGGPLSIAVDSVTHDVYVPGVFAGTISVINGDRVVRTIEFDLYMDFPRFVAVDSATHTLYVTHIGLNTVSVIHGSTTTQTLYVTDPGTPKIDPETHAVYVPSRNGSVAVIRDPSNRDFTTDGRADVLARDTNGALWLYPTNGAGAWLPPDRVGQGWNSMASIVAGGDFNSDGRADVLATDGGGAL